VVFVAVVFRAAVAVDSEIIAVDVVVVGFFAVAVVVADKFSADVEVLPLHVVASPGVESDVEGFAVLTPRRRSRGSSR